MKLYNFESTPPTRPCDALGYNQEIQHETLFLFANRSLRDPQFFDSIRGCDTCSHCFIFLSVAVPGKGLALQYYYCFLFSVQGPPPYKEPPRRPRRWCVQVRSLYAILYPYTAAPRTRQHAAHDHAPVHGGIPCTFNGTRTR